MSRMSTALSDDEVAKPGKERPNSPQPPPGARGDLLHSRWDQFDAFTPEQVAEVLQISKWTIWELAKQGRLPFINVGRRKIMGRRQLIKLLTAGE